VQLSKCNIREISAQLLAFYSLRIYLDKNRPIIGIFKSAYFGETIVSYL
jgi:hypothetical protein